MYYYFFIIMLFDKLKPKLVNTEKVFIKWNSVLSDNFWDIMTNEDVSVKKNTWTVFTDNGSIFLSELNKWELNTNTGNITVRMLNWGTVSTVSGDVDVKINMESGVIKNLTGTTKCVDNSGEIITVSWSIILKNFKENKLINIKPTWLNTTSCKLEIDEFTIDTESSTVSFWDTTYSLKDNELNNLRANFSGFWIFWKRELESINYWEYLIVFHKLSDPFEKSYISVLKKEKFKNDWYHVYKREE